MKKPVGKKSKSPSKAEEVTITIMRKYSVRPYETLDVSLAVTTTPELYETQEEMTARAFKQMKKDMVSMANEVREMAKANDF